MTGTLSPGLRTPVSGIGPVSAVLDRHSGDVFVADYNAAGVSVFGPGAGLLTTIPVGRGPDALAYDPSDGEVFVANSVTHNVSVINDTTLRVVASVPVGAQNGTFASAPISLAFDPASDRVYVAEPSSNCCTSDVSEIDARTNSVSQVIYPGATPIQVAGDPAAGAMYALVEAGWVAVVNVSNGSVATTTPVSGSPAGEGVDAKDGILAVLALNGTGATILQEFTIMGTSLTMLRSVPVFPWSGNGGPVPFDAASGQFLVQSNGSVIVGVDPVLNTTTTYSGLGRCLTSVGYDPIGGVVTTDGCSDTVALRSPSDLTATWTGRTGVNPLAILADGPANRLYVASNAGDSVVEVDAGTMQTTGVAGVGLTPFALAYDPALATTFVASTGTGLDTYAYPGTTGQYSLSAVPDSTGQPAASWPLPTAGDRWQGLTFDPGSGLLFLVGATSSTGGVFTTENLSAIDPQTGHLVRNLTVQTFSAGSAYASYPATALPISAGVLAVSDPWDGRVIAVNLTNGGHPWSTDLGGTPSLLLADPFSGNIDVVDSTQAVLRILTPTGQNLSSIPLGHPAEGIAFDPRNERVYVAESTPAGPNRVEAWDERSGAVRPIQVPAELGGVAFVPSSGLVAVAGSRSGTVFFLGSALAASPINLSATPPVQGVPVTLSTQATGGFAPETFVWSSLPPGCASANVSALTCTPGRVGTWDVGVNVTDLAGELVIQAVHVSAAAYPLVLSVVSAPPGSSPTNGSTISCQVTIGGPNGAAVENRSSYFWNVQPTGSARLSRTNGTSTTVQFLAEGKVTLGVDVSFNGTLNSSYVVFHIGPTSPPTMRGAGGSSVAWPPVGSIGLLAGAAAAVVALAGYLVVRRRRRARRRSPGPGG